MANPRSCAHCLKRPHVADGYLCNECTLLPRCEVCEVFFDGLVSATSENPARCKGCLDFEKNISFTCHLCDEPISLYVSRRSMVLNYIVRGNSCGGCNKSALLKGLESKKDEDQHQFIGYLAILERLYDANIIGKDEWEHAIRRNKHDVTNWRGLEELRDEELEDEE